MNEATSDKAKGSSSTPLYSEFSGEKALQEVAAHLAHGARPPGSPALEAARSDLEERLQKLGWQTNRQRFTQAVPLASLGKIEFCNLRARFPYKGKKIDWEKSIEVLIGSHYDTKYYSYYDFMGANDGGSSSGSFIELARVLALNPKLASQIELVFFDGEECYVNYGLRDGLFGSRHYVSKLQNSGTASFPERVLIWDMIGDKDLRIVLPANGSREIGSALLRAANDLGYPQHFAMGNGVIVDDHKPFHDIGIPAIDIIDIDYEHWHTPRDTLDKLSAQSLEIVGKTTLKLLETLLSK